MTTYAIITQSMVCEYIRCELLDTARSYLYIRYGKHHTNYTLHEVLPRTITPEDISSAIDAARKQAELKRELDKTEAELKRILGTSCTTVS